MREKLLLLVVGLTASLQSTFIGQSQRPVLGLKNKSSSQARTEWVPPSQMWYTQQSFLSGKKPSSSHLKKPRTSVALIARTSRTQILKMLGLVTRYGGIFHSIIYINETCRLGVLKWAVFGYVCPIIYKEQVEESKKRTENII